MNLGEADKNTTSHHSSKVLRNLRNINKEIIRVKVKKGIHQSVRWSVPIVQRRRPYTTKA